VAEGAPLDRFATDGRALRGGKYVAVDSDPPGAALTLSHHFGGNATPAPFRDDLAAGAALKWAASPERREWLAGAAVVYNDHFDVDGFLAAWVALNPDEALGLRREVLAAAAAGDFDEWTDDRAVQFAILGEYLEDPAFSALAREAVGSRFGRGGDGLYGAVLRELPELLLHPERMEGIWRKPYDEVAGQVALLESGRARVEERSARHLSMVVAPRLLLSRAVVAATKGDRLLQAAAVDGGFLYQFRYRPHLSYRIVSRPVSAVHEVETVAAELNARWPTQGETWKARGWWQRELRLQAPRRGRERMAKTEPGAALAVFEEAFAALDAAAVGDK
jgi:hypothetical protein